MAGTLAGRGDDFNGLGSGFFVFFSGKALEVDLNTTDRLIDVECRIGLKYNIPLEKNLTSFKCQSISIRDIIRPELIKLGAQGEVTCSDAIFEIEGLGPEPRLEDMVNPGTAILGPQQV